MNKEKEFEINFACELNTLSLEEMSKQYFRKLKNKDKKIKKQEKKYRKLEKYYSQQIIWLKENKIEIDKIKQKLQAKEQECEQLRGGQHHQGKIIKELTAECERLKEENFTFEQILKEIENYGAIEEIIQQLEAYKMEAEEGKEINAELKAENEEWKEYIKHLHNLCGNETDKQYEYKQTLTEIKEIAEKIANYYDGDEYELMRKDAEQILQKISEVRCKNEV